MSRRIAVVLASALPLVPELARACAVCGAGVDDDQSRVTYLLTTALLSLLPLGLFGGLVLWLRRQYRRQRALEAPPPPA